jgi:LysR family transcriptional regulator, flagellar master operon regulator
MDINLATTFLEIVSCRSFAAAAERLHVTQTAVSARIRHLEELLGQPVFVRNKSGALVTAAGKRFMPYAQSLVQVWERARLQVAVPAGRRGVIAVGCEPSLWDPLLVEWLVWMRAEASDIALRTEISPPIDLLDRVANGSLDIAIVYAPQHRPGLMIEFLMEEKLVLVTTHRALSEPSASDYIYVDWGREFAELHAIAFPELSAGGISANLGPLARDYLLAAGGSGYFRQKVVRSHLQSGRLFRIAGAPEFPYPAYAVYAHHAKMDMLEPAIAGLKQVTSPHHNATRASTKRRRSA